MITTLLLALACHKGTGDDTNDTVGDTDPTGGDDSGVVTDKCDDPDAFSTSIEGDVSVELYVLNDDGDREAIAWEDAYGDDFPFGGIWVTATRTDDDDNTVYLGETVIRTPTNGANPYTINATTAVCGPVNVVAVLDLDRDRVIGADDPNGIHPNALDVDPDTSSLSDVDVSILAPGWGYGGGTGGPGGGWGGPGGGTGGVWVEVAGEVLITTSYADGEAAAFVFGLDNSGPWATDFVQPISNGSGADAAYSIWAPENAGAYKLLGAWDSDNNWLFDPTDTWGAYISAPDVDGNPLTIGAVDINADIQIPLNDGDSPWGVVPFVSLSGDLGVLDGTFDDLPSGSTVTVAALKYRPTADLSLASIEEEAYSFTTYAWADLTGNATLPYSVRVPANTVVYLWAYADTDNDGNVNEPGEHVASSGEGGSGQVATGESSATGLDLELSTP